MSKDYSRKFITLQGSRMGMEEIAAIKFALRRWGLRTSAIWDCNKLQISILFPTVSSETIYDFRDLLEKDLGLDTYLTYGGDD